MSREKEPWTQEEKEEGLKVDGNSGRISVNTEGLLATSLKAKRTSLQPSPIPLTVAMNETIGKFKILKVLGKGAFATVFEASLVHVLSPSSSTNQANGAFAGGKNNSDNISSPLKNNSDNISSPLNESPRVAVKLCSTVDLDALSSLKVGSATLLDLQKYYKERISMPLPSCPLSIIEAGYSHIINYIDFVETREHACLALELVDGIELFDFILNMNNSSSENNIPPCRVVDTKITKKIMKDLLQAVAFIHSAGYSHGDIKLENIMVIRNPQNEFLPSIKLIDFGLSIKCKSVEGIPKGSPLYFSPESVLVLPRNPQKADIWACGVVLFVLLTLRMPFDADQIAARLPNSRQSSRSSTSPNSPDMNSVARRSLARKIAMGSLKWKEEELEHVSPDAQDFVSLMLRRIPEERVGAIDLLDHPFLK